MALSNKRLMEKLGKMGTEVIFILFFILFNSKHSNSNYLRPHLSWLDSPTIPSLTEGKI